MYVDHDSFRLGARTYGEIEFTTPHGTASGLIDTEAGVLRLFVDTEVDPLDWDIIAGMLTRIGIGDPGEPGYLSGVYSWVIRFRAPAAGTSPAGARTGDTGELLAVV